MAHHHQAAQRRRLRAALSSMPGLASKKEIDRHMTERGYEQDMRTGKWKRRPHTVSEIVARKGPNWKRIAEARARKARRRRR